MAIQQNEIVNCLLTIFYLFTFKLVSNLILKIRLLYKIKIIISTFVLKLYFKDLLSKISLKIQFLNLY